MNNGFRVTVRTEFVPFRFESVAELREIVNLTIEHDPDRVVLIGHRLATALDVEDAKPAMRQPDATIEIFAGPVRSAMGLRDIHARDQLARDRSAIREIEFAGDAAHALARRPFPCGLLCAGDKSEETEQEGQVDNDKIIWRAEEYNFSTACDGANDCQ